MFFAWAAFWVVLLAAGGVCVYLKGERAESQRKWDETREQMRRIEGINKMIHDNPFLNK